ncbi:MAG: hypothetical protein ABII18_05210 [bacterium]|nr:hypothetical protein [bacterium]
MQDTTRKITNIFNIILLGFMVAFLCQCGGASDALSEADVNNTTSSAALAETSITLATTAVEASATEANAAVNALMRSETEEEYDAAEDDVYTYVLHSETRDCLSSGTFYVDAENNLISFDECVNTVAGSTLTADGDLTLEITETGMTAQSDIMVEMEWVTGDYGQITQLGTFTSELADNISTIDFEDFDGEVTCAGETIAYYVDGFIDYDLDTDLIDGEISVTYDGISTDCEFEDFDLENATAAEWYQACGGLSISYSGI